MNQYRNAKGHFVSMQKAADLICAGETVTMTGVEIDRAPNGRISTRRLPGHTTLRIVNGSDGKGDTASPETADFLLDALDERIAANSGKDSVKIDPSEFNPIRHLRDEVDAYHSEVIANPLPILTEDQVQLQIEKGDWEDVVDVEWNDGGAVRIVRPDGVILQLGDWFRIRTFRRVDEFQPNDSILTYFIETHCWNIAMPWYQNPAPEYDDAGTMMNVVFVHDMETGYHSQALWEQDSVKYSTSDPFEIGILGGNPEGANFDEHGQFVGIGGVTIEQHARDCEDRFERDDTFECDVLTFSGRRHMIEDHVEEEEDVRPGLSNLAFWVCVVGGLGMVAIVVHSIVEAVL